MNAYASSRMLNVRSTHFWRFVACLAGVLLLCCTADASVCRYALDGHRASNWRLVNRHDNGQSVSLFYKLTKYESPDPKYELSGEGVIEVVPAMAVGRYRYYSSYF